MNGSKTHLWALFASVALAGCGGASEPDTLTAEGSPPAPVPAPAPAPVLKVPLHATPPPAPTPIIKVPTHTPAPAPVIKVTSAPPPPPSAPATAPSPVPTAPVTTSNLRVTRTAHTPPPAPTVTPPVAPAEPAAAPKPGGLGVSRKAHEPVAPKVETAPPPPSAEVVPEEDSFAARRAKRLAEAQTKQAATHQEWGKTLRVIRWAAVVLVIFIGISGWYSFIGSAPSTYYYLPMREGSYGMTAKLFSPDELVVADGKSISLHDLKAGQARWTTATKSEKDGDNEDRWSFGSNAAHLQSFGHDQPV